MTNEPKNKEKKESVWDFEKMKSSLMIGLGFAAVVVIVKLLTGGY